MTGAQLSWESICLTSRGSQVRALLFPPLWPGSSVGQNASLSRQRSWVRAPSRSPFAHLPLQLSRQSRGLKILVSLVRFRPEAPKNMLNLLIFSSASIFYLASYSLYADLAHLVERNLAKVEVASSSLVIRSRNKRTQKLNFASFLQKRCHRQVVRPRSATPLSPVQIWVAPP